MKSSLHGYLWLTSPPPMGAWSSNLCLPFPIPLFLRSAFRNMQAIHKGETRRNPAACSMQNPVHKVILSYEGELFKKNKIKKPLGRDVCEPSYCSSGQVACLLSKQLRTPHFSHCSLFEPKIQEREKNTLKMYSISRPKVPPTSCPLVFSSQVTWGGADFDEAIHTIISE